MELRDRVAIVTGAGRNIGEGVARVFARQGAHVAVVDVDAASAQRVASDIEAESPGAAMAVACDVSSAGAVQEMTRRVLAAWGRIDVLVNNVAITDHRTVLDLPDDEWDAVLRVTLTSVFLCTKHVGRAMVDGGRGGCIINVASTSGHRGRGDATAYPAAKGGVLNLTRSVAIQLAPYGIRVNSITPNRIGSPVGMSAARAEGQVNNLVRRVGTPEDIAAAALFLASDASSFVTASDVLVDGGALAIGGP